MPSCPGGGGKIRLDDENAVTSTPNTTPTSTPSTAWESWVASNNDGDADESDSAETDADGAGLSESDAIKEGADGGETPAEESSKGAEEGKESSGYDSNIWANWGSGSQSENTPADDQDLRWWTMNHSYCKFLSVKIVMCTIAFLIFAY